MYEKPHFTRAGEFPSSTWRAVRSRGVCAECEGGEDDTDPWHVHHRIFLASEAARQFPLTLLSSLANANLMHRSCHYSFHNQFDEPPQTEVDAVVKAYTAQLEHAYRLGAVGSRRMG